MASELLGVSEVAQLMGVSRQRVDQLTRAYDDFPAPAADLASGRVWRREAVEKWIESHPERRPGRPPKKSLS